MVWSSCLQGMGRGIAGHNVLEGLEYLRAAVSFKNFTPEMLLGHDAHVLCGLL